MQQQVSLGEDTKVIEPVGLKRYKKVSMTPEINVDLHTTTDNFAPNEYGGVVNSSGLVAYKGLNARDRKALIKVKAEK